MVLSIGLSTTHTWVAASHRWLTRHAPLNILISYARMSEPQWRTVDTFVVHHARGLNLSLLTTRVVRDRRRVTSIAIGAA